MSKQTVVERAQLGDLDARQVWPPMAGHADRRARYWKQRDAEAAHKIIRGTPPPRRSRKR